MRNILDLIKPKKKKENRNQDINVSEIQEEIREQEILPPPKKKSFPVPIPILVLVVFVIIAGALAGITFLGQTPSQPPLPLSSPPQPPKPDLPLPPLAQKSQENTQLNTPNVPNTQTQADLKEPSKEPVSTAKETVKMQDTQTAQPSLASKPTIPSKEPPSKEIKDKEKPVSSLTSLSTKEQEKTAEKFDTKTLADEIYALKLKEEKLKRQLAVAELERRVKYGDPKPDLSGRDIRDVVDSVRREVNMQPQGFPPQIPPNIPPHMQATPPNIPTPMPIMPPPMQMQKRINLIGILNNTAYIEVDGGKRTVKKGDRFENIEIVDISKNCLIYGEKKTVMKQITEKKRQKTVPTETVEMNTICVN